MEICRPVQPNSAVGLLLAGATLLSLTLDWIKISLSLAGVVGALGALTLAQNLLNIDLAIDNLFIQADFSLDSSPLGRPGPNTALCLMLSAAGMLAATRGDALAWRGSLGAAVLGASVAGLGLNALFGYVGGVETAYGWGRWTSMAFQTAGAFTLLGTGLFFLACSQASELQTLRLQPGDRESLSDSPEWLAIPVGVGSSILAISLWQTLIEEARARGVVLPPGKAGLPEIALAMGLLMAVALTLMVVFAQRLRLHARRLEESNLQLAEAILKAERSQRHAERYSKRLEASNRELEQFAYVASHDLKAPLRAVAGYVQLLQKRYSDRLAEPEAREFMAGAVENALQMTRLIEDLLELSRIQRAEGQRRIVVPLDEPLEKVLQALRPQIQAANASIIREEPLPSVRANPTQMRQVFQNLLDNALKFRSKERDLVIRISSEHLEDENAWRITVRDTGIGFHQKYAPRVFEVFKRLQGPGEYPGTGMGLAICKKIIERHDGRVEVDAALGVGAAFHIILPASLKEEPEESHDPNAR
jgi:signal transduction histidine kinase